MGKMTLPETVKFAKIGYTTTLGANAMDGRDFSLMLGPKEIGLLLSIRVMVPSSMVTNLQILWALNRKSMPSPLVANDLAPASFGEKDDICATGGLHMRTEVGGSFLGSLSDDFIFPYPLIVIRNPALWTRNMTELADPVMAILYYLTQQVTDEDLARMMVKDHA